MKKTAISEPWLSFLKEIDKAAPEPVELQCLGGFVINLPVDRDRTNEMKRARLAGLLNVSGDRSAAKLSLEMNYTGISRKIKGSIRYLELNLT